MSIRMSILPRTWLRNYASSREVASSNLDGVDDIFVTIPNHFQPHYDPGVTQPLTEISTKNLAGE
jgi:hypothetical protein